MKRSKSGAQKRKEAVTVRDAVAKLPKMTDFFKTTEQSRPGTSTERDEENYRVQEKEDYDDQHQSDCEFPENISCDLPANTQPSISKITESQFTPIPDDPCKWPESISDAQRCDIVKRGPHQLIMNFPYNNTTPRRRFSSNHHKRVLPNGESVSRSWLVYSGESDIRINRIIAVWSICGRAQCTSHILGFEMLAAPPCHVAYNDESTKYLKSISKQKVCFCCKLF